MRNFIGILEALLLLLAVPAFGQAPTPTPVSALDSFTVTASAMSIPGSGKSTLAGTFAGVSLKITPNFQLEQVNFISSAAQTNSFMAGGNYDLNFLSKKLNDISPNLSGYDFRFSVHGDVGYARIVQPSGNLASGPSALFGGQADYAIHGSSRYSLGVRIDDFFVNSGLPSKNNLVVAVGPTIHF